MDEIAFPLSTWAAMAAAADEKEDPMDKALYDRGMTMRRKVLGDEYVDRAQIANELSYSRRLCSQHGWPVIDVTRRSIEETAAAILQLYHERQESRIGTL